MREPAWTDTTVRTKISKKTKWRSVIFENGITMVVNQSLTVGSNCPDAYFSVASDIYPCVTA